MHLQVDYGDYGPGESGPRTQSRSGDLFVHELGGGLGLQGLGFVGVTDQKMDGDPSPVLSHARDKG